MARARRVILRLIVGAVVVLAWFAAGLRVDRADRAASMAGHTAAGQASADQASAPSTVRPLDLPTATLALIAYPWEATLAGWTVEFMPARYDVHGLTFTYEQRIEVYVRPTDDAATLARVLAHELGHAIDLTLNDAGDRDRWLAQRGVLGAAWWPGDGVSDFGTGAGDFAECFATWQVSSVSLSEIAGPCTPADVELISLLAAESQLQ
jgi:hypothetical protein